MTHEAGEGSMGSRPSQAIFIGNLALALMVVAGLATAVILIAAMLAGGA
ncbi:MAG: hypothetical protein ACYC0C_06980 [Devosia sp.]